MKKTNATLALVVLVVFAAISWYSTFNNQAKDSVAYKDYIESATKAEEKGIYIDALENYKAAHEVNPEDYELVMKLADMYYKINDIDGFITYSDMAISMKPEKLEPYINKANYYNSKSMYTEAMEVVNVALSVDPSNEVLVQLEKELSVKYIEKYASMEYIGSWHILGNSDFTAMQSDGKWGLFKKDGSKKLSAKFEYIGVYDAEAKVIPCSYNGDYYYIDINGYKKLVGDNKYQYLGSFGNGWAPAQLEGKYGYIDTEFNEKSFEYDYAGAFANGVAAVSKNGKWALIDSKLKPITEFEFDDILRDSYGYCSMFDVIVAKKGNEYLFIGHDGKQIVSERFSDASMPASNDGYIAVKIGDMWGFADQKGKTVIRPAYTNARSFAIGLAPVQIDGMWGYIDTEGTLVIDAKYYDAGVFSQNGAAPVKTSYAWNIIVLCEYDK